MATSNTFNITAGVTSFACDFGATDKETIVLTISSTGAVISSNDYSILGVAASATAGDITIEWDDAGDYVGETLIVSKYTNINTGAPADSMLVTFTSSGTTNPTNIQNEFAHLYDIVGQITGGTAVGTVDLGTVSDNLANVDALADIMFASPTQSGGHWDGSDTLSIGGDTTVEGILTTHETRLDSAENTITTHTEQLAGTTSSGLKTSISNLQSLIGSPVGLPNPTPSSTTAIAGDTAAPLYALFADTLGVVGWGDIRSNAVNVDAVQTVAGVKTFTSRGLITAGILSAAKLFTMSDIKYDLSIPSGVLLNSTGDTVISTLALDADVASGDPATWLVLALTRGEMTSYDTATSTFLIDLDVTGAGATLGGTQFSQIATFKNAALVGTEMLYACVGTVSTSGAGLANVIVEGRVTSAGTETFTAKDCAIIALRIS